MKILFDFLPIILFFIAYTLKGIWAATAVAIVASLILFAWIYFQGKKPNLMQWFSVIVIVLFGGATLILDDSRFIQAKPSVLYLLMGLALIFARYALKRNLLKNIMGEQLNLPSTVWDKLNLLWFGFFVFMAALNWFIAATFSQDTWAYFKMFGTLGLTIVFVIAQSFYLAPFMVEKSNTDNSTASEEQK